MKNIRFRMMTLLIVVSAMGIFIVKGSEAKDKWVFKMKDKYENKKNLAQKKLLQKRGGILLDDIEMQAFHS